MSITYPAKCKACSMIRFFNAKHIHPAKFHRQLLEVCKEGLMNEKFVLVYSVSCLMKKEIIFMIANK